MAVSQSTVIVVEDSDDIRDVITLVLEGAGYKVLPVEDGETAILMSRYIRPALITLDIGLPREGGDSVLDRLKADPETHSIPILVISGHPNAEHLTRAGKADAVLLKPFDIDDLQRTVRRILLAS